MLCECGAGTTLALGAGVNDDALRLRVETTIGYVVTLGAWVGTMGCPSES